MTPNELIQDVDVVTWTFTVDVSGYIPEIFTADIGHCITVANASGASYIGNIYALAMSDGIDKTYQLVGHDSMKVDTPYLILTKGTYYLRTDKTALLIDPSEGAGGTLRVGSGG